MTFDAKIEKIQKLAEIALSTYGHMADNAFFGHHSNWSIVVGELPNRALGVCYIVRQKIVINAEHVQIDSWEDIKDTVLHEVAHALAGVEKSRGGRNMAHGKLWKSWAKRLGAKPSAKAAIKRDHLSIADQYKDAKYLIVCFVNNNVEVYSACNRKLKNLHTRGMRNKQHTFGNLFHVKVSDYNIHKDDTETLMLKAFR